MKRFIPAVLLALGMQAHASVLLSEGFDDIGTLAASGWVLTNLSVPLGNDWFQGNSGVFASQ